MRRKPCDRFAHVSALDQGGLRSYGLTYRAERCEARAIKFGCTRYRLGPRLHLHQLRPEPSFATAAGGLWR